MVAFGGKLAPELRVRVLNSPQSERQQPVVAPARAALPRGTERHLRHATTRPRRIFGGTSPTSRPLPAAPSGPRLSSTVAVRPVSGGVLPRERGRPRRASLQGNYTLTLTVATCDADKDGVADASDQPSPPTGNPDQSNLDDDALGDACDLDIDGDTRANSDDGCPR